MSRLGSGTMWHYYDAVVTWLAQSQRNGWSWFRGLDRQEWLVLLALTTLAGFLCMRGFGSRDNY